MSSVNGVHALLTLLMQQAHSAKQTGDMKVDVKQLEHLLQESRLLNERLLKIERLLARSPVPESEQVDLQQSPVAKSEGNWPAAGLVRDMINRQERQQAFGSWQAAEAADTDAEPFVHRLTDVELNRNTSDVEQLLIQKYVPTDNDLARAEISALYGMHRGGPEYPVGSAEGFNLDEDIESRNRLIVFAIGLALLLLTFFLALS